MRCTFRSVLEIQHFAARSGTRLEHRHHLRRQGPSPYRELPSLEGGYVSFERDRWRGPVCEGRHAPLPASPRPAPPKARRSTRMPHECPCDRRGLRETNSTLSPRTRISPACSLGVSSRRGSPTSGLGHHHAVRRRAFGPAGGRRGTGAREFPRRGQTRPRMAHRMAAAGPGRTCAVAFGRGS